METKKKKPVKSRTSQKKLNPLGKLWGAFAGMFVYDETLANA